MSSNRARSVKASRRGQTREDAETVKDYLVSEHKLYRMHLAFYASGSTLEDLRGKTNRLCSVLLSHDLGADRGHR